MKLMLAIMAVLLISTSCTIVQTPLNGTLFVQTTAPTQVVSEDVTGTKKGTACATGVLGIVTGDSSITTAANNGKIKKITHVDHTVRNVLFVYSEYCTVVYGR